MYEAKQLIGMKFLPIKLNSTRKKKTGCTKYFHVHHYTKYFDVTTSEVIRRSLKATIPILPGSIYSKDTLRPDMYGPLWTVISLYVCIPIFGNLNLYFHAYKANDLNNFMPDLSNIWSLMGCLLLYFLVVPYILHTIFRFGSGFGSVDSRFFFIASIYGYSFTPFVPGIIAHTIPNNMVEWAALLLPTVSSFIFMTKELIGLASVSLGAKRLK